MSIFATNTTVTFRTRDGRIEIYRSVIENYPNSMLAKILEHGKDSDGTYYINIDSKTFHEILDYLSDGSVPKDADRFNRYMEFYGIKIVKPMNEYQRIFSSDLIDVKRSWSYDIYLPKYQQRLRWETIVDDKKFQEFLSNLVSFNTYYEHNYTKNSKKFSDHSMIMISCSESLNENLEIICIRKDHFDKLSIFKSYEQYVKLHDMYTMRRRWNISNDSLKGKLKDLYYLSQDTLIYRTELKRNMETYEEELIKYYTDLSPENE